MKKLIYYVTAIFLATLVINSCSKKEFTDDFKIGAYVRFQEATPAVIGVEAVNNLVFQGILEDPTGNVAQYNLRIVASLAGSETDTFEVGTYTSFPVTLSINASQLADLLGVTVADLGFGDSFFFFGTVTSKDGAVYYAEAPTYDYEYTSTDTIPYFIANGLTSEVLFDPTTGYRDGFLFDFTIGCPENSWDVASFLGTYDITNDPFEAGTVTSFDIIDGPGADQITLVDVFGMGYDIVVDVDPVTNEATIEKQEAWDSGYWGLPYGIASVEGSGYVFPCVNSFSFTFEHTVAAGSFGSAIFQGKMQ